MNLADTLEAVRRMIQADTLTTRGRDALDFHSLSVQTIRDIVEYAHLSGQQAGIAEARTLIAGTVAKPATLNQRHAAASRNELATAIAAAEDCIDPRSVGEDPERWDEMTGPMGGGR
jgi:hypothetical protein